MRRFEFVDGSSSKFWEIALEGKSFTVRYGKIGTAGQTSAKSFSSEAAARVEHDKLVAEKLKKGYREAGSAPSASAPASKTQTSKVASPEGGKTYKIFADYHHFYLCDRSCTTALGDAWTPEAVELRLAIGDGVIGIGTARNVDVPVEVQLVDSPPPDDSAAFQHVTECSVPVPTGKLVLNGPTDSNDRARVLDVPKGTVVIRASHTGLDTLSDDGLRGKDRYRLQIWPGKAIPPRVLKQWTEPQKQKAEVSLKPPKTWKQAVALARAGHPELALPKLVELSRDKAEGQAAYAASHLLAFQGDFRGAIEHAGIFSRNLTVFGASNPHEDTLALLRLAGKKTGDWDAVVKAAEGVAKEAVRGFHDRAASFVKAIRAGKRELTPLEEPPPKLTAAGRAEHASDVAEAHADKRLASRPADLARRLFTVAVRHGVEDEALTIYRQHASELYWDSALDAARILSRRKENDEAWKVLEAALPAWSGGLVADVAPIELLLDPALAEVMTQERAARVLMIPRSQ